MPALTKPSLSRLSAREQLEAWSQLDDGGKRLRKLPAELLYGYIQEVGLADAVEAVRLASPRQLRAFIDLDAWRQGEPDLARVLLWLRAARGSGGKRWLRKLRELDVELFELVLRERLRVHDLDHEEAPPEVQGASFTTPDNYFLIELPDDPAEANGLRLLIDDLYAGDPAYAQRILAAARWELVSELTEQAHRWRSARLADLGFPSLFEALSLYSRTELQTPPPPSELPREAADLPVAGQKLPGLLQQAMASLPAEQAGRVQAGLLLLSNSALVADGVDPGDPAGARGVLDRVAATLSLGLCQLSSNDAGAAARILLDVALKRIFQVGFTQTLELQWAAERAVAVAPLKLPGTDALLLDSPWREVFTAVRRKRPLFPGALDEPGAPNRPFRTPLDLATVRDAIDRSAKLAALVVAAGVVPEQVVRGYEPHAGLHPFGSLRFSDLFLTALAKLLAGGAWTNAPLSPAEAGAALRLLLAPGDSEVSLEASRVGCERLEAAARALDPDGSLGHLSLAKDFWGLCAKRLRDEVGRRLANGEPPPAAGPLRVGIG
jgi:hypothetical protein